MFSVMGLTSGVLSLFFPDTHNVKLPDTIEEAINLKKKTGYGKCQTDVT